MPRYSVTHLAGLLAGATLFNVAAACPRSLPLSSSYVLAERCPAERTKQVPHSGVDDARPLVHGDQTTMAPARRRRCCFLLLISVFVGLFLVSVLYAAQSSADPAEARRIQASDNARDAPDDGGSRELIPRMWVNPSDLPDPGPVSNADQRRGPGGPWDDGPYSTFYFPGCPPLLGSLPNCQPTSAASSTPAARPRCAPGRSACASSTSPTASPPAPACVSTASTPAPSTRATTTPRAT